MGALAACSANGSAGEHAPTGPRADDDTRVVEVVISDGQVRPAARRVEIPLGTALRIEVSADVSDVVHVHGYDLTVPVTPTEPAVVELTADIPGVFEVEVENTGLELLQLQVS